MANTMVQMSTQSDQQVFGMIWQALRKSAATQEMPLKAVVGERAQHLIAWSIVPSTHPVQSLLPALGMLLLSLSTGHEGCQTEHARPKRKQFLPIAVPALSTEQTPEI